MPFGDGVGMAGWIFMGSLGNDLDGMCLVLLEICLSSIVKVRKGIRHQPDPERRPKEADWVCTGLIMPLCMSSRWYKKILLWYYWSVCCSGHVGLSPQCPNGASMQREITIRVKGPDAAKSIIYTNGTVFRGAFR